MSPHQLTETATWNLCMASAHGVSTCDVNPLSLGQRTESQNLVGPRCSLIHRLCCLGPDPGCPRGSHAHPSPGPSPTLPDQGLMQAVQAEGRAGTGGRECGRTETWGFLASKQRKGPCQGSRKGGERIGYAGQGSPHKVVPRVCVAQRLLPQWLTLQES